MSTASQSGYTGLVRQLIRLLASAVLIGVSGAAVAQLVVPEFGSRGDVPEQVMREFMAALRDELAHTTGLEVLPGELVTQGIAASLEPEFGYVVASLGGGRYGLSGEVANTGSQRYTATIMVADQQERRASDLFSESFQGAREMSRAAGLLANDVNEFIHPAEMLAEGDAELFISSQPAQAEVFIRGVRVGETGVLDPIALEEGSYQVEFRKEGFLLHTEEVEVESGRFAFLHAVLTPAAGGSVQVTSRPRAEVFIDGESKGWTPVIVEAQPGMREVLLERPGFLPERRNVPVRSFRINRISASLRPASDSLIFWEPIRGTLVFVNGLLRVENYVEGLPGGLHTIELWRGAERNTFRIVLTATGVYELDLEARQLVRYSP